MKYIIILVLIISLLNCKKESEVNKQEKPVTTNTESKENSSNEIPQESGPKGNYNFAYVDVKAGLILREQENRESKKIDLIPYGTKLEIEGSLMGGSEEIGGLMGHWMEVEYNNKKGFIFSGYLSLINPKIEIKDRWNCRIYSNSPQDGYSSDEYVFYADNSFITLLNAEGEEVVDSGSYEDKGSEIILNSTEKGKFSFYKIEKVLTTKEYKSIIEKEPTIGKRLEKAYESGGDPGKEETIFQCENMKDLEAN